jgi:hypothetical protein
MLASVTGLSGGSTFGCALRLPQMKERVQKLEGSKVQGPGLGALSASLEPLNL